MILLVAGVLLFTGTHLYLSLAPGSVASLRARNEGALKGLISLGVAGGMGLIIFGWRSAEPSHVYTPNWDLRMPSIGLMVIAICLLVVAGRPSRVKRVLRHPQLTGVGLWAVAHLLMNGDSRSVILFGGLLLWVVVSIPLINRRDGEWQKPEAPAVISEVLTLIVSAVVYGALVWGHQWLAGVPVMMG